MAFINRCIRTLTVRLAPLAALAALLSACATSPHAPPASGVDDGEPTALPAGPITPNPYAQQRATVSAEARAQFEQASAAMAAQQWRDAEQQLLTMAQQHPHLSGVQVNLGLVYHALDELELAERALRRALEINPLNLDAYNQLALLKRERGEFDRAAHYYLQALDVWPFHAVSHRNLGILYDLYQGRWEQALRHYRAYQQLQEQPQAEVTGWIIDLERRIANQQAAQRE